MASYSQIIPLVATFFLLIATCASLSITFNTTMIPSCYFNLTAGCSFYDPTIWENSSIPSTSDDVYITSADVNLIHLYFPNSTLNLHTLTLSGTILLEVQQGSDVQVANLTLSNAQVVVRAGASLASEVSTKLTDNALLELDPLSAYHQIAGSFDAASTSTVFAHDNASLALSTAIFSGTLTLSPQASFSANTAYFYASQSIAATTPSLSQIYVRAVVNFTVGLVSDRVIVQAGGYLSVYQGLTAGTSLAASGGSSVTVYGSLVLASANISGGASVTVSGGLVASVAVHVSGSSVVSVLDGGLKVANFSAAGGSSVSVNGTVTVTNMRVTGASLVSVVAGGVSTSTLLVDNATLSVYDTFYVSQILNVTNSSSLVLHNAKGTINSTYLGAGDIKILSSQIKLNTSYTLPNARLTFVGSCSITAPTISLLDLVLVTENSQAPYVRVILTNGTDIEGLNFLGELTVTGHFSAGGEVVFSGPVTLVRGTATVSGSFTPLGGLFLNSTTLTLSPSSTINASYIYVDTYSTFLSLTSNSILSHVVNSGAIQINANQPVTITGAFTQIKTGKLTINKLNRDLPTILNVGGSANVAGSLEYEAVVIASGETIKLPVLTAEKGLTGTFLVPTRVFERYSYDSKTAYIIFSETSTGAKLFLSWMVVAAFAVALL